MSCCKEYAQSISEYLDGALNEKEQQRLLAHIESCEGCRAYLGELAAMQDALAKLPEVELPEGFHKGVMEKVRTKKRAKKAALWKRYAAVAACAAIVFAGAVRLMPDLGAGSAAPEAADMAANVTESGAAEDAQVPAAAGGAERKSSTYAVTESTAENFSYQLDTEAVQSAEPQESPAEEEAEQESLPVVRGENAREMLLSLGAQEPGGGAWLMLVPAEVLENLPESLELDGEFDASEELILVLIEEVAA